MRPCERAPSSASQKVPMDRTVAAGGPGKRKGTNAFCQRLSSQVGKRNAANPYRREPLPDCRANERRERNWLANPSGGGGGKGEGKSCAVDSVIDNKPDRVCGAQPRIQSDPMGVFGKRHERGSVDGREGGRVMKKAGEFSSNGERERGGIYRDGVQRSRRQGTRSAMTIKEEWFLVQLRLGRALSEEAKRWERKKQGCLATKREKRRRKRRKRRVVDSR